MEKVYERPDSARPYWEDSIESVRNYLENVSGVTILDSAKEQDELKFLTFMYQDELATLRYRQYSDEEKVWIEGGEEAKKALI